VSTVRCTAVAATVLRGTGAYARVLLLHRAGGAFAGAWSQVTGRIEDGETAWQATAREVREETGVVADALYAAGYCDQFYNPVDDTIDVVPMFVAIAPADCAIVLNAESDQFRWATFAEAETELAFLGHRIAIREVRGNFAEGAPPRWTRIEAYTSGGR
jgi:dATP pyrophosphohydrolase